MKTYLYLLSLIVLNTSSSASERIGNLGCIRQNSDEIRRYMLFMHLENGQMPLVLSMLDSETVEFTSISGQTIEKALNEAKTKHYKIDIGPVLQRLEQLKKQKIDSHPQSEMPD